MSKAILGLVLVLVAAPAGAQDGAALDNARHPWLRWKEGSYTRLKMTVGKNKSDMVHILKEVTEEGFVTEIQTKLFGSMDIFRDEEKLPKRDGEETLKLEGKDFKCTIWKAAAVRHGKDAESKYWIDDGGRVLKIARTLDMFQGPLVVQAVKAGEKRKVKDRELECLKLEGTCRAPTGADATVEVWTSPEVPGGTLRTKVTYSTGKADATMDVEVVDYEGKK